MKVYIVTLNYNPYWGLRDPDNRDRAHEVKVCSSKELAHGVGSNWVDTRNEKYRNRSYQVTTGDLIDGSVS